LKMQMRIGQNLSALDVSGLAPAINLSKPGELPPGHWSSFGLCQPADRGRVFGLTDRRDA
jgi:hypothetical protein